jgi:Nucleotidyl transferase AbiEii toxin, Type IV TA system
VDLAAIRRLVIIAMFSDDALFGQFALKGGNALNLVHRFGSRSSIDVDLSLETDFLNLDDSTTRILSALKARFAEAGLTVFDEKLLQIPARSAAADEKWGGYQVEFKLMDWAKYESMKNNLEKARREALVTGPEEQRIFRIQISKYEYCRGKMEAELDDYAVVVYTPEMIAIEKLRAICQQMPEYVLRKHSVPRARDFYDIYETVSNQRCD